MKRILVIDDEFEMVEALKATLEAEGYDVTGCCDSRQAIAKLRELKPALVITDLMMPFVSGYEVVLASRDLDSVQVRTILMSSVEPSAKQAHFKWDRLLRKPFQLEDLTAAVETLIGKASGE